MAPETVRMAVHSLAFSTFRKETFVVENQSVSRAQ
jgi:hypothetical protein